MRAAAIAIALNVLVAAAPARAASPSPFQVVDAGPLPVTAPGQVTVRLRLQGGDADAGAELSFSPTRVDVPRVGGGVTARVRDVHTEGAGRLINRLSVPAGTPASMPGMSRDVADQACARGGYPDGGGWLGAIGVDAHSTVDVVATIDVPPGLHGVPAAVTIYSSQLTTDIDPLWGPHAPGAEPTTLALPRLGPTSDVVSLSVGGRVGERVRLRGQVTPPRSGVTVELAGRRTPNTAFGDEVLGSEHLALAPIGPTMRHFGEATTDEAGRWSVWLTLPPRVAVVARTAAEPGVTLGGASCGLWFSSPTLDRRVAEARRKANAERRQRDKRKHKTG